MVVPPMAQLIHHQVQSSSEIASNRFTTDQYFGHTFVVKDCSNRSNRSTTLFPIWFGGGLWEEEPLEEQQEELAFQRIYYDYYPRGNTLFHSFFQDSQDDIFLDCPLLIRNYQLVNPFWFYQREDQQIWYLCSKKTRQEKFLRKQLNSFNQINSYQATPNLKLQSQTYQECKLSFEMRGLCKFKQKVGSQYKNLISIQKA